MALKIKESNGIFFLDGIINYETSKQFKNHLEFLIAYTDTVTINIDKVLAIDKKGLKVIEHLFNMAKFKNKSFFVIGNGCKDIYESINFAVAVPA